MTDPFLGEIRMASFNFAPQGWAFCNGQILPINQNQALFSLLGTMYGGNGQTNFALPDLQSRLPMHTANGFTQGQVGGEIGHTLQVTEMPAHTHQIKVASSTGSLAPPTGNYWAGIRGANAFTNVASEAIQAMNPAVIGPSGGSQPHENRPPFLVINFMIALAGIFPTRN